MYLKSFLNLNILIILVFLLTGCIEGIKKSDKQSSSPSALVLPNTEGDQKEIPSEEEQTTDKKPIKTASPPRKEIVGCEDLLDIDLKNFKSKPLIIVDQEPETVEQREKDITFGTDIFLLIKNSYFRGNYQQASELSFFNLLNPRAEIRFKTLFTNSTLHRVDFTLERSRETDLKQNNGSDTVIIPSETNIKTNFYLNFWPYYFSFGLDSIELYTLNSDRVIYGDSTESRKISAYMGHFSIHYTKNTNWGDLVYSFGPSFSLSSEVEMKSVDTPDDISILKINARLELIQKRISYRSDVEYTQISGNKQSSEVALILAIGYRLF